MASEVQFPRSSFRVGIGVVTYFGVLLAVCVPSLLFLTPPRCDILLCCGDVELNPGPTPLLSDDLLKKLQENDTAIAPPTFPLQNKHVYQLFEMKGKHSWATVVNWLRALIPDFPPPSDSVDWSKNINTQWKSLMSFSESLWKSIHKSEQHKSQCDEWNETVYNPPPPPPCKRPRPRKDIPSSSMEMEATTFQNKKLIQENDMLKLENEDLKQ